MAGLAPFMEGKTLDKTVSTKTTLTVGGGSAAAVIIWVAAHLGIDIPGPVAAALATLVTAVIAWAVPARQGKYVHTEPVIPEAELLEDTSDTNGDSDYDDPDQTVDDRDDLDASEPNMEDAEGRS